jgi:hypothetical protein
MRDVPAGEAAADPLLADPLDVCAALQALAGRLDGAALPNGVIELVVDERRGQARCLLDVHDGVIAAIKPGSAVPWASIAGTHDTWAQALRVGATAGLRFTGEEPLARGLLAAILRRANGPRASADQPTPA